MTISSDFNILKKIIIFFYVIYILEKIALKTKLLCLYHDNLFANYFKIKKIYVLMQKTFY